MKGSLAKTFGAIGAGERRPTIGPTAAAATTAICLPRARHLGDRLLVRLRLRDRHREAEIEADEVAHRERVVRRTGDDAERRLHRREGGDDLAPDVLDGGERQLAPMAHHEAAHHVGLAVGPEGGAGLARALDLDQLGDDAGAVDQEPVHRPRRSRRCGRGSPAADRAPACPFVLVSSTSPGTPASLAAAPAERKENIEASTMARRAAFARRLAAASAPLTRKTGRDNEKRSVVNLSRPACSHVKRTC